MTLKRLLPLLRGLFGIPDLNPVSAVSVPAPDDYREPEVARPVGRGVTESRLAKVYFAKKVLYQSKNGRRLTARVVGMSSDGAMRLRRAGHPLAPSFVRSVSSVFPR